MWNLTRKFSERERGSIMDKNYVLLLHITYSGVISAELDPC